MPAASTGRYSSWCSLRTRTRCRYLRSRWSRPGALPCRSRSASLARTVSLLLRPRGSLRAAAAPPRRRRGWRGKRPAAAPSPSSACRLRPPSQRSWPGGWPSRAIAWPTRTPIWCRRRCPTTPRPTVRSMRSTWRCSGLPPSASRTTASSPCTTVRPRGCTGGCRTATPSSPTAGWRHTRTRGSGWATRPRSSTSARRRRSARRSAPSPTRARAQSCRRSPSSEAT
mmetsp:Transcript_36018/g.86378  ORF Transcript_36018/g.86378 Transcript_36018/m.86378 type:complete len:226 (-) Transcript_36018:241-918(-)